MTDAVIEGLVIQGGAGLGLPLPSTGYARLAYGNVTPDFGPARWLSIAADGAVTVFAGSPQLAGSGKEGFEELPFVVAEISFVSHPQFAGAGDQKSTANSAFLLGFLEFSNRL